ncbi:hypothetical protein A0H81_01295 [Grifola frondosa]|uniref:Uncharacterized protein n=1 Tax=Grifola frondosa TaxID=5627 RepID=A0A1C7MQ02_GRIFR|nr:hypothetical protein A0H81_01295 [Grifola frondosa]
MQMPVQEYGTLQFGKFEDIQKKGYHAAMELLEQWDKEGRLPSAFIGASGTALTGRTRGRTASSQGDSTGIIDERNEARHVHSMLNSIMGPQCRWSLNSHVLN